VISGIDFGTLRFDERPYLWLLVIPAVLAVLWCIQLARRRSDRRAVGARVIPAPERYALFGDLPFWLCLIVASALVVVALARPQASVRLVRRGGVDLVILQDGSASMYVSDIAPDRWRRSVKFIRALAEAIAWRGDRVALALFSQRAAPQIRLTKDPNALFFFLDHLTEQSPFRLEDAATWDTNIEEGVFWGLRLVETDEELFGASKNTKAFVVISDGQAWSGEVANALRTARQRGAPVFVVGVGSVRGGMIPEPLAKDGTRPASTIRAVLDRESLRAIATAGGGEYFEIGHEPDRDVAFRIISSARRLSKVAETVETREDLYWRFLAMAAAVLGLGTLLLRSKTELAWQAAGALVAVLLLVEAFR
jgi:Ca-activated chloride channel family protein